jgi:hypothetical protein
MKPSKSLNSSPIIEAKTKKDNAMPDPAISEKSNKPSWGAYYLLVAMAIGMLLVILKIIGLI